MYIVQFWNKKEFAANPWCHFWFNFFQHFLLEKILEYRIETRTIFIIFSRWECRDETAAVACGSWFFVSVFPSGKSKDLFKQNNISLNSLQWSDEYLFIVILHFISATAGLRTGINKIHLHFSYSQYFFIFFQFPFFAL